VTAAGHKDRRVIITAAPPTPNGDLHLGHLSGPYSGADILTRACRLQGAEALFLTGSDLHQSYVPVKAAAGGLDPLTMADTFAAEIAAIFQAVGFIPDAYVLPQRSELHVRMVGEFFTRLCDRGALRERTEPGLFCRDCQRYLFEAHVTGHCPHCGATSDGNSCENCALPNSCVDLVDPKCNACGGQPETRPVTRLVFPLAEYESRLRSFHATADISPQIEALCAGMLDQGLPDIPVTHPTDWGIKVPVPGFGDQRIYVWAEMLPGYFAELAHVLKATGRNPADWSAVWNDPATEVIQFFGYDNGYFHAVLQPALLMAYDPSFKLPTALITNEFYQLGSSKFSTSRRHAIWPNDLLAEVPASVVRFVLACDRPEAERTSFGWDRFGQLAGGVLADRWQAWLGDLFCRLAEQAGGQIPSAGRLNRSQKTFLKTLGNCTEGIIEAYRPPGFSPRRAARLLTELVCCAADYAAGQARTRARGHQDPAAASALAVEAAAALALAKLAAPIMPDFADQLWAALGEQGPIRWDGVRLPEAGHKVLAGVRFFAALPEDLEEMVMTAGINVIPG
jgi:methionyl-tRNA synthetase